MRNSQNIIRIILVTIFLIGVGFYSADKILNRYQCEICGGYQYEKLYTHTYNDGFKLKWGNRCDDQAYYEARKEQNKLMNNGYKVNDEDLAKKALEILRERS